MCTKSQDLFITKMNINLKVKKYACIMNPLIPIKRFQIIVSFSHGSGNSNIANDLHPLFPHWNRTTVKNIVVVSTIHTNNISFSHFSCGNTIFRKNIFFCIRYHMKVKELWWIRNRKNNYLSVVEQKHMRVEYECLILVLIDSVTVTDKKESSRHYKTVITTELPLGALFVSKEGLFKRGNDACCFLR